MRRACRTPNCPSTPRRGELRCPDCLREQRARWMATFRARKKAGLTKVQRGTQIRQPQDEYVAARPAMRATGYNGPPCWMCETPITPSGVCPSCGTTNRGVA